MATDPSLNSKSLVLVVGAGASKEVGLPVGEKLKQEIASSLSFRINDYRIDVEGGDHKILAGLYQLARMSDIQNGDVNPYLNVARLIKEAMPLAPSIDHFIDSHKSDIRVAQCGKLAITSCILKAERYSHLWVDSSNLYNNINFTRVEQTWFARLFQLIAQGCQKEDVVDRLRKLAVISFNYDRCLEHFLHGSLRTFFKMTSEEAAAAMNHLQIFHPYGTVGALPWNQPSPGVLGFGGDPSPEQLRSLALQLRTFTESTDPTSSEIVALRSTLRSAKKIAYLGFAFHPMNLELLYGLEARKTPASDATVYATAFGISNSNVGLINEEIISRGGYQPKNVTFHQTLTAAKLIEEYSRSLTL